MAKKPEFKDVLMPEVNVGMVGHVDHGKTSLTQALTGKWTDTHSEEIKRGITIRIGYADATFYKCEKDGWGTAEKCIRCFSACEPVRTVSFVDAPGHETLMTTVLSGAAIMDGALLVISAQEKCPQPQTREHLMTLEIVGIKNIVIVQNKIDLVTKEQAMENYRQIKEFVKGTIAEKAPVIPVSAKRGINIDALIEAIEGTIPTPERDLTKPPKLLIARSFDVNRPGTPIEKLTGGVVGGSLVQGKLRTGDEVEIRPGVNIRGRSEPLKTKVAGIRKANREVEEAGPGGLLGISTTLDPSLTRSDNLVGTVMGRGGGLPQVWNEIEMKTSMLKRVVGSKEELVVEAIKPGDMLLLTAGISRTIGTVASTGTKVKVKLRNPICAEKGGKVALARQVVGRWRLIGWGELV